MSAAAQRGVGGKREVSPGEETTEGAQRPRDQKPWVSEERSRLLEAARRGRYRYHGRIAALAEGARKAGLKF